METNSKVLTLRLEESVHRNLKIKAAEEDTTMQDMVVNLIHVKLGISEKKQDICITKD